MNTNEQMRDAIGKILWCCQWMYDHTSDESVKSHLVEPIQLAKAALALPRRNCDVGTAEEQEKRWHKNCGPGIPNCKHCKVYGQAKESGFVSGRGFLLSCSCKFVWAQMPYGKGGANGIPQQTSKEQQSERD